MSHLFKDENTNMLSIEKNTKVAGDKEGLEIIKKIVSDYYEMPQDVYEKTKRSRKTEFIKLRQVVAHVTKTLFPLIPLKTIGKSLGLRNHATVINALKRIGNLIETEKKINGEVTAIIGTIMNAGTIEALELRDRIGKEYFYLKLENIKVLKLSKESAIVFTGIPDEVIKKVKNILNFPDMPVKEFRQTGLSILEKKHDNN